MFFIYCYLITWYNLIFSTTSLLSVTRLWLLIFCIYTFVFIYVSTYTCPCTSNSNINPFNAHISGDTETDPLMPIPADIDLPSNTRHTFDHVCFLAQNVQLSSHMKRINRWSLQPKERMEGLCSKKHWHTPTRNLHVSFLQSNPRCTDS